MKITSLKIKNYRSLVDVEIPLSPLTVLIGPNGSGKTALLEVIQLLCRSSRKELKHFLLEQGGFQSVLSHVANELPPNLTIGVTSDSENGTIYHPLTYELTLSAHQFGYSILAENLAELSITGKTLALNYLKSHAGQAPGYYHQTSGKMETPTWEYDILETALAQVPKTFAQPETFRNSFATIQSYMFLDVTPRAAVRLPQSLTPGVTPGSNGEHLFSALYNLRTAHENIYQRIITLLEQGFPDFRKLEFPVVGSGQISLTWHENGYQPFYPNQLSEGTLRFLWLITLLLSPDAPTIILLDEPEISLHPELLKLLAAVLQDVSASSQIFVGTHSSDLIRWLRPEEVLIVNKEDGFSRFTWANELENLGEWLEEYTLRDLWLMGNLGGRP